MPTKTPVDEQIVVFISSKQREFQTLRDLLKDTLDGEDFLQKLLISTELAERRSGERVHGDIRQALSKATIYVGLFGNSYSAITIAEYQEARRRGLPLIIFNMVRSGRRDDRVRRFLDKQARKLDDCKIIDVPYQPKSPMRIGQAADTIMQRIANVIADMAKQNLDVRRTFYPRLS